VMRGGFLQQVERPQVLYDRPANLFVAGFIGSPAMNMAEAELAEEDGGLVVRFGPHTLPVPAELLSSRPALRRYLGRRVGLGIRPEDLEDAAVVSSGPRLSVPVDIKEDMGSEVFLHFAVDAKPLDTEELREISGDEAIAAADELTHHHGSPWVARVDRTSSAREGERVELAVLAGRLHFFDLDTGEGIYGGANAAKPTAAAVATV